MTAPVLATKAVDEIVARLEATLASGVNVVPAPKTVERRGRQVANVEPGVELTVEQPAEGWTAEQAGIIDRLLTASRQARAELAAS